MDTTSVSLLENLRRPGDQAAWNRFTELYAPLLYGWARRLGLQPNDAADLVQDVFAVLVRKLPEFRLEPRTGAFRRWLRTITLNTWRDRRKRRGDRPLPGDEAALAELADPAGLEPFWEGEYRQHLVNRALSLIQGAFRPATWKAFWEQVVAGRPAKEVAAELGLTPGAVYAAKLRVLDRLRQDLAGMLD